MKKRLSMLLIGSLVALSLAGCSGAGTSSETPSVPDESTTESSVQSAETSAENSKTDGVSKDEKNTENFNKRTYSDLLCNTDVCCNTTRCTDRRKHYKAFIHDISLIPIVSDDIPEIFYVYPWA